MKLDEALQQFLTARAAARCRASTLALYARTLRRHLAALPVEDAGAVTPAHIDAALAARAPRVAAATLASEFDIVRAFWAFLVKRGIVPASPVQTRAPHPPPAPLRDRSIAPDDMVRILEAARAHPRDYALVCFLADTGCRAGAARRLRIADLRLDDLAATVEEKGGKVFEVNYTEACAAALRAWLAIRPAVEHDYVFLSRKRGTPLAEASVRKLLDRLAEAAGVEGRHNPHAWRHALGKRWVEDGVPVTLIAAKLGHSSTAVTVRHYLNQTERALREATARLSPLGGASVEVARQTATGTVIRAVRRAGGG